MKFGVREIAFVALLMVIPVAAWWLDFRPNNTANAAMQKEVEVKRKKLKALNRATGTIGDLKNEIASLELAISHFQAKLPNEKEIDKVLKEVSRLAETNQLITKSIRTSQKTKRSSIAMTVPHAEQPIDMHLEGNFNGFYSFILALENQPRIMRVSKMKVKKLKGGSEGQVRIDLTLSIFFEGGD